MSRFKEIGTAAGTLACALGIGFIMQSTETADVRYGGPEELEAPEVTPQETVSIDVPMDVEQIVLTSALPPAAIMTPLVSMQQDRVDVAPEPVPAPRLIRVEPETVEPVSAEVCTIQAETRPVEAAFIDLSVSASCRPDERVTIHHDSMVFTQMTDASGMFSVRVPAMTASAVFILAFPDGDGTVAQVKVPDLSNYKRVALQWTGAAGFELHAREFGAEYGSDGHVWHGAEQDMAQLVSGTGGYMSRLGEAGSEQSRMVEVYTFPADMSGRNGQIDLSVEAVIGDANCNRQIEAQALHLRDSGDLRTRTVMIAVPDCDTAGDYLVLNNIFEDLKVAAR